MPIVLDAEPPSVRNVFEETLPLMIGYSTSGSGRTEVGTLPPLPVRTMTVNEAESGRLSVEISAWRYLIFSDFGLLLADIPSHSPQTFSSLTRGLWADRFHQTLQILDDASNCDPEDKLHPSVVEFPSLQTSALSVRGLERTWYVPMSMNGVLGDIARTSEDAFLAALSSAAVENVRKRSSKSFRL